MHTRECARVCAHRTSWCACGWQTSFIKAEGSVSICRKGHHASPTCCAGHPCQVGPIRVPSLATHRSLRDHHHKHRRVIWTTAKEQKNRKCWLTNLERSPKHPQPMEHNNHLPHERWSPTNNRAVTSTPPCRRNLLTDHQVLNRPLQLALLQVFDPRAAQRKPFTNLEPSSGLEVKKDNSVESKSQKGKNYSNPVPQALGKIRLSEASTALCIAVLVLDSTDAMASWMKWPVLWAPADGHTCRCPLGTSCWELTSPRSVQKHSTSNAKECAELDCSVRTQECRQHASA